MQEILIIDRGGAIRGRERPASIIATSMIVPADPGPLG